MHLQGGRRLTYLLTSVTFDRDYSALQIIHRQGSIIIEAERESRGKINESFEDVQENVCSDTETTQKHQTFNLVSISSSILHVVVHFSYSFSLLSSSPGRSCVAL